MTRDDNTTWTPVQREGIEQEARDRLNEAWGGEYYKATDTRKNDPTIEAFCRALEQRNAVLDREADTIRRYDAKLGAKDEELARFKQEVSDAASEIDRLIKHLQSNDFALSASKPAHEIKRLARSLILAKPAPVDPLEAWLRAKMGDPAPQFAKTLREAFKVEPLEHAMTSQPEQPEPSGVEPAPHPDEVAVADIASIYPEDGKAFTKALAAYRKHKNDAVRPWRELVEDVPYAGSVSNEWIIKAVRAILADKGA